MSNNLPKGTVKWFNVDHNYGFIKLNDDGSDLFFHGSQMMDKKRVPYTGDKVEFEIHESKGRKQAKYVDYLDKEDNA